MDDLWAKELPVACIHPGWQVIRGRTQVMASWQAILSQDSSPDIDCEGATASIFGETALVLCEELLNDGRLVATNIFVREDGEWRLCHHQAGPLAQPLVEHEEEELGDEESETIFHRPSRPTRRLLN